MIIEPSARPELFWVGINDGFYALESEQVSIGCRANVGAPEGKLEISFIREWTVGTSSSRHIISEILPVSNKFRMVNGVLLSHTGLSLTYSYKRWVNFNCYAHGLFNC